MSVYLDASVVVALLVEEALSDDARAWMKTTSQNLILGDFTAMEVAAALSRGCATTAPPLACAGLDIGSCKSFARAIALPFG